MISDPAPRYLFQKILLSEFEEHKKTFSSRGSLRSFSKKLGVNSGTLYQVLQGNRGLNPENANRVILGLNLNPEQRKKFLKSLSAFRGRHLSPIDDDLTQKIEQHPFIIGQMIAGELVTWTGAEVGLTGKQNQKIVDQIADFCKNFPLQMSYFAHEKYIIFKLGLNP